MSVVATQLVRFVKNFHFTSSQNVCAFVFRLPAHILRLNLQSRQQDWLVHCGDFLFVCYLCLLWPSFVRWKTLSCTKGVKYRLKSVLKATFARPYVHRRSYWSLFVLLSLCCSSAKKDMKTQGREFCAKKTSQASYWLWPDFKTVLAQNEDCGFYPPSLTCLITLERDGRNK